MEEFPSVVPVKLVLAFTRYSASTHKREGGFLFLVIHVTFAILVSFRMDTGYKLRV